MSARTFFMSVRFRVTGTSEPAAGAADGSTANTLKFSSPPKSLINRMYFESRDQKVLLIGRFVSAVSNLAFSNGSSARLTQMFIVSLYGLRKAMNFPSGEIEAPA